VEVERELRPPGRYRLPPPSRDGLMRRRDGGLVRLLHHDGNPVVVHARIAGGAVRLTARAHSREAAEHGIARMRFVLCLDLDLVPFRRRFARDRLLGRALRAWPWLLPRRRPEPFEAFAWAVCAQLIDSERAEEIARELTRRHGRRAETGSPVLGGGWGLRDSPPAAALADRAPAELEACGLAHRRALALWKAAREVARGRVDLAEEEPAWRRLRAIPNVGSWTVEKLAYEGQGRLDQIPAGDLAFVKLVGRLEGLGRRATEDEVRAFFTPYEPYQALAGTFLVAARHTALRDARGRRRAAARS
jgi:DNA-3-methyladenine glycosylase II